MESMIIENCPICSAKSYIEEDCSGKSYIENFCSHRIVGPSCKNEADAIKYWNAMMRGLKSELTK